MSLLDTIKAKIAEIEEDAESGEKEVAAKVKEAIAWVEGELGGGSTGDVVDTPDTDQVEKTDEEAGGEAAGEGSEAGGTAEGSSPQS